MDSAEPESDEELMRRFQNGDESAYEHLVKRNVDLVQRQAKRFIPDPASADDISQQVFMRVWSSRDRFAKKISFRGWLMTITRNIALNELRTRKRKNWTPSSTLRSDQDQHEDPNVWLGGTPRFSCPEDSMLLEEQLVVLQLAVDNLPELEREAIYLSYFENWPLDKIAQHIGKSGNATKSYLFRIRKKLSNILRTNSMNTNPKILSDKEPPPMDEGDES